jgi:KDO2-lipid IV(A) lauroyltransferase
MAREVWINLAKGGAEFARKYHVKSKNEFFRDVEIIGEENFRNAYNRGKGVVCITPHLGSWECIPWAVTYLGFKAGAVGKPLTDERLNALIIKSRERMGFKILPRGSSYKTILNFLKSKNALGMLIDQDTNVKGVFVNFYGNPAYTPVGAAMLALDAEAEVIPVVYRKKKDDTFQFIVDKAFEIHRSGNREEDLQINTENFHRWIEAQIKEYPTQWVWMHERWKTTPETLRKREERRMEQRRVRRLEAKKAKQV